MPKPDPALLDFARYRFCCSIETRFADLDVNMHINNVALVGLLEEGRVRYHRASGTNSAMAEAYPMVASFSVEFLGQSFFPDPLEIRVAAAQLGRTSYTLAQVMSQQDRVVAYAQAVMVCMNKQGPVELPVLFRERLQAWMLAP